LVDYTRRLFRDGKATLSAELSGIISSSAATPSDGGRAPKSSARAGY
jgi:hypothetical protein